MNLGNKLKKLRKSRNLTLQELADKLNEENHVGTFNKGRISKWENNKEEPRLSSIKQLADFYGINIDSLYLKEDKENGGYKNINLIYNQLEESRQIKVYDFAEQQLEEQNKIININKYSKDETEDDIVEETMEGYLSAGTGEFLAEDIKEPIRIHKSLLPEQHYDMILQVNGDSMEPMFEDHEYVFIRTTKEIRSGQIGVFIIDGESLLKKAYINDDHLRLVSLNKKYEDLIFDSINDIHLIGTVVM